MPIPVVTDHYLVQVTMVPDNLPDSNSFVHTMFFRNDAVGADADDVADNIKSFLDDAYNTVHSPATVTLASQLSIVIDSSDVEYRVYDLGQAAPRTPHPRAAAWSGTGGGGLPNELAVCMSYYATTNTPRKRGRVFIGPLSSGATTLPSGDQDVRVHSTTISAVAAFGTFLIAGNADLTWVQYSRAANLMSVVTDGWVDNAFDIQRRRGAKPSVRTPF